MKRDFQLTFVSVIAFLFSITASWAHGPGGPPPGGGGGAPHMAAPAPAPMHFAAPAPHFAAPPQMHFAAPQQMHFAAPQQMHFSAPPQMHFAPPRQMHFAQPQTMHFAAPHQMRAYGPSPARFGAAAHGKSFAHAQSHIAAQRIAAGRSHAFAASHAHQVAQAHRMAQVRAHQAELARGHETAAGHSHTTAIAHDGREGRSTVHEANTAARNHAAAISAGHEASRQESHSSAQRTHQAVTTPRGTLAASHQRMHAFNAPGRFINPRHVGQLRAGEKPHFTQTRPHALTWKRGANIPRPGRVGKGKPGIVDPGGYIRAARKNSSVINRDYMQRQLATIPNYSAALNNNNRSRISNPDQWPGRWHPGRGWANLGYYTNYWWNNNAYPLTYYAPDGFTPTPYVFYPDLGEFWDPGMGYADSLPYGYGGPITVAVEEVVPVYDAWGHIIDYRTEMFYYNAFWDPSAQAYGFYDYRGAFHWLTFPWLNSWMG